MSTALDRIRQQASVLQLEGKTPSLALLRSRLGKQLHPAELLQAFQQWKQLPESERLAATIQHAQEAGASEYQPEHPATAMTERIDQLEQRLQQLEQLVDELQHRLEDSNVGR